MSNLKQQIKDWLKFRLRKAVAIPDLEVRVTNLEERLSLLENQVKEIQNQIGIINIRLTEEGHITQSYWKVGLPLMEDAIAEINREIADLKKI